MMIKKRVWIGGLSLLTAVSVQAQQPQQQDERRPPSESTRSSATVTIQGRVYLPNGAPIDKNIRVTLRLVTQAVVRELFTDSVGNFEIKDLPINTTYELLVQGTEEYETTTERVDAYSNNTYTERVNIHLRKKDAPWSDRVKPGVVSVTELDKSIPKAARKEYQRGLQEARKGNSEKAIARFQRAIALHEPFFQAHNELGLQFLDLERWEDAEASLTKAIDLNPRVAQTHVELGYALVRQNRYDEAVDTLTQAVDLDGSQWRGHLWLGVSLMNQGKDLLRSQHELEKALQLSHPPEGSISRLFLANLFIRQGDLDQAITQAEIYLQEVPNAENAAEVREHIAVLRAKTQSEEKPQS